MLIVALSLAACSSAGGPGANEVIDQIDKAKSVQLEAELRNVAVSEEAYFAQNETYSTDLSAIGLEPSAGIAITIVSADASAFCAEAAFDDAPDAKYHVVNGGTTPEEGPCPTS